MPTCASTPRAFSQRANQKPSRPASKASAIRVIFLPALTASSRQRCSRPRSLSALGSSFFCGWRSMPGSTPATSQLDWLSSTTAMIVLSWSKATRDLLKSFGWGIRALRQLFASDDGAISSPPAPYHLSVPREKNKSGSHATLCWRKADSNSQSRVASRYRHVMPWIVDRRHYVPSAAAIACPAPPRTALSFAQVLERNLLWQRRSAVTRG